MLGSCNSEILWNLVKVTQRIIINDYNGDGNDDSDINNDGGGDDNSL